MLVLLIACISLQLQCDTQVATYQLSPICTALSILVWLCQTTIYDGGFGRLASSSHLHFLPWPLGSHSTMEREMPLVSTLIMW